MPYLEEQCRDCKVSGLAYQLKLEFTTRNRVDKETRYEKIRKKYFLVVLRLDKVKRLVLLVEDIGIED